MSVVEIEYCMMALIKKNLRSVHSKFVQWLDCLYGTYKLKLLIVGTRRTWLSWLFWYDLWLLSSLYSSLSIFYFNSFEKQFTKLMLLEVISILTIIYEALCLQLLVYLHIRTVAGWQPSLLKSFQWYKIQSCCRGAIYRWGIKILSCLRSWLTGTFCHFYRTSAH